MKQPTRLLLGSAVALALLAGSAHASLILSGTTGGSFQSAPSGNTTIINTPDMSSASFLTGRMVDGSLFRSGVTFENSSFTGIESGDTFGFGMLTYYNGRTIIGTSSANALFDFYLNLDGFDDPILLTTVNFGIDATVNTPDGVNPDVFTASFVQPPQVLLGGQWVQFAINELPTVTEVRENTFVQLGEITVTFLSPVPEPSTYGLIGAAGLLGLVAYRRFRAQRGGDIGGAPLAAA